MSSHSGFEATGDIDLGGNELKNFDVVTEAVAGATATTVGADTSILIVTGTGTAISTFSGCRDGRVLKLIFTHATPNTVAATGTPANNEVLTAISPAQYKVYTLVGYNDGSYTRWYVGGAV